MAFTFNDKGLQAVCSVKSESLKPALRQALVGLDWRP